MTGVPDRRRKLAEKARHTVTGLVPNTRSFLWATRAIHTARHELRSEGSRTRVRPPGFVGPRGTTGVRIAVVITRPTCLERALVLQGWISGYSETPPDVVIGIRKQDGTIEAHAWVDGSDPEFDGSYEELTRLRP